MQVKWYTNGGRINSIKKAVDHVLCLFPFEPAIYHAQGINATYVGHPLASEIPDDPNPNSAKDKLKSIGLLQNGPIGGDETVIAVLPGSRHSEINLIAPVFFDAINSLVHKSDKNFRFLVPVATPALKASLVNLKHEVLVKDSHLKIDLIDGYSNLILEASDVVLIASGTATLEAALWKKPMVISYKVPWLTAQIMKRQGYLPYVGLPNILSGEFVVPELLQDDATPDALAQAILDWLNNPLKVSSLIERFKLMHFELKRPTAKLSAEVIASIVKAQ
jgi:lipid-A-disaccharide synthase